MGRQRLDEICGATQAVLVADESRRCVPVRAPIRAHRDQVQARLFVQALHVCSDRLEVLRVRVDDGCVLVDIGEVAEGLDAAAEYIAEQFRAAGLEPAGDDGSYFQAFTVPGADGVPVTVRNVLGVIPGSADDW